MGFFSQECHSCGRSVLNPYSTTRRNGWMMEAVTVSKLGEMHIGYHDGYGRVGEAEYAIGASNTVWHRACWELVGRPMEWMGSSEHAQDQGYFFEDSDPRYDVSDPREAGLLERSSGTA